MAVKTNPTKLSATLINRAKLLEPVERAAVRLASANREFHDSSAEFQNLVRSALSGGVSVADLVRATGMSRARIYQIQKM